MTAPIENEEIDEKPRTLFVGNIPSTASKRELEVLFGDVGPLKRCYLQYPRKGEGVKQQEPLVAYVTYALTEDATTAVEKFSNHKIGKNKINIKLIKSRSDQYREPRSLGKGGRPRGISSTSANLEPLPEKPKVPRPKPINKKPRLIVRNLSFNATKESIKEHFTSCGNITEINILKKPNGKLVGCAFVQFGTVFEAAKAIKTLNLQPFLDRPIAIDWAVPKDKFQSASGTDNTNTEVKDEPEDDVIPLKTKIKDEEEEDNRTKKQTKKDKKKPKRETDDSDDDYDNADDDDDDDEDDDEEAKFKPQKRITNDADEGKTLFIRNLNFDTTETELKEFFEKFGPLHYALVCKDPLTEHPKGTAFVKFKELESAEKCLAKYEEDQDEFTLGRRNFYISVALSKGKLESKINSGKEQEVKKDNRHLYLTREGFIRPGSEAAVGVSIQDMNQRSALHQKKKQMLKDLSVFVSDKRLCVHNLPPSLKDDSLKKIFLKFAGPGAQITEAKIMRDLKSLNLDSKEYGFITFTEHEHALQALRKINNNPTVFTPNKRPIVEFSLENRKAIIAKERRLEKSKEKNSVVASAEETSERENKTDDVKLSKRQQKKLRQQLAKRKNSEKEENESNKMEVDNDVQEGDEVEGDEREDEAEPPKKKKMRHRDAEETLPEFSGLTGKKGVTNLPSFKAKGKITRKSLKPKKAKKFQERRMKEPKTRPKSRDIDRTDNVDKMVNKHQKEIKKANKAVKPGKKWFD